MLRRCYKYMEKSFHLGILNANNIVLHEILNKNLINKYFGHLWKKNGQKFAFMRFEKDI